MVARTTGLELALEVGDLYLLWKEDGLRVSLRALSGHPKATLPRSTLTDYVNVASQARELGSRVMQGLGLSLQVALLPCRDPEQKRILAAQALDEGWSVLDLKAAVAEARGVASHRVRVRRLTEKLSQAADQLERAGGRQSLDRLSADEREQIARSLEEGSRAIVSRLRKGDPGPGRARAVSQTTPSSSSGSSSSISSGSWSPV